MEAIVLRTLLIVLGVENHRYFVKPKFAKSKFIILIIKMMNHVNAEVLTTRLVILSSRKLSHHYLAVVKKSVQKMVHC